MIEVTVDSIRVHLMTDYRVIMLKEIGAERYLPIYIGPFEAEAIAFKLQDRKHPRPFTHDLLNNLITDMGGEVIYIFVNDRRQDTYYARIHIRLDGQQIEIDARPSDAIALAVRANAPIFVAEHVMAQDGITPEIDLSEGVDLEDIDLEELSAFREFVDNLDLDDLPLQ